MHDHFTPPGMPFFGSREVTDLGKAHAVIFGAPHGTPYPGIDNRVYETAPDCLRAALGEDSGWHEHWDFDFDGPLFADTDFVLTDAGNLATSAQDGAGNRAKIRKATANIVAAGAVPIMIGGDDSTPIPFIDGMAAAGPLTIVQIDAHIDWRDERFGEPLGFSSTMRRASEMAHVERIVQVGMNGIGSARRGEVETARAWGAELITARRVHREGVGCVLEHIAEGSRCLITLDCDALDAGIMPAVMAPAPGGLTFVQVTDLIHCLASRAKIAGLDVIEFVPQRDGNGTAALTMARVLVNAVGALVRQT